MTDQPSSVPVRSAAESKDALTAVFADLIAIVRHGFAQWEELGGVDEDPARQNKRALRNPLSARSRASWIYDHIAHEARRRLAGRSEVKLTASRGFLLVFVGSSFVLRFKKLDSKGLSRNYQTHAQKLFSCQLEMFGLGEETRLTLGYQLDELGRAIKDIRVVCPVGPHRTAWQYSLLAEAGDASGGAPAVPQAPITPMRPPAETTIVADPTKIKRDASGSVEAGA
jgi:hypothetical protein